MHFLSTILFYLALTLLLRWGKTVPGQKGCIGNWHPVDNMLRDVYIYYGTSFIRVESFCFILSSWKKFRLNRGWNGDKI